MAQEFLNVADVGAVFKEMRRETVAQAVDAYILHDAGFCSGGIEDRLCGACGKVCAGSCSREQPVPDHD